MQYTHLGRTGLKVSRIAPGTMNFGELADAAASFKIMVEALDVLNGRFTPERLPALLPVSNNNPAGQPHIARICAQPLLGLEITGRARPASPGGRALTLIRRG